MTLRPEQSTAPAPAPSGPGLPVYRTRSKGALCYLIRAHEGLDWEEVGRRARSILGGAGYRRAATAAAKSWAKRNGAPWPPCPSFTPPPEPEFEGADKRFCRWCGRALTKDRRRVYCSHSCGNKANYEDRRRRSSGPKRERPGDEADILAPAHCGWCGAGLAAGKTHCNAIHKQRHEEAAAELGQALKRFSCKDSLGVSERSARRASA